MEAIEKLVNLVKNVNISLSLGGDLDMVYMSPFLLILLCFVENSL